MEINIGEGMMKVYRMVKISMSSLKVVEEDSFDYVGPIVKCSGSGPSGEVDYPDYMEDIHVNWLTGGTKASPNANITLPIEDAMNTALSPSGNPYLNETVTNPSSDLADVQSRFDSADTIVTSQSPTADWKTFLDKAIAEIDSTVLTEAEISDFVDKYEAQVKARRLRQLSRFTGGMADVNAVQGSQFVIGMALLESEMAGDVDNFEAMLRVNVKKDRLQGITSFVQQMVALNGTRISSNMNMAQLRAEINRIKMLAVTEYEQRDLELKVRYALWDLEVYQYGGNLLSAVNGGFPNVEKVSKFQTALGNAAMGAQVGAVVGTAVPFIGTEVGAGVGAAVGAIGSLF